MNLSCFLSPRSVAIIGFSTKAASPSRFALQLLTGNSFAGDIYLVGRTAGEFEGRKILASVDELPEGVELALILVPAAAVAEAVAAAVRRRIKAGVVFASGFAELGEKAREKQDEIARTARDGGLSLMGPNCLGFANHVRPLNIGFLPQPPVTALPAGSTGAVAIVMQSGGLMAHVQRAMVGRNLPLAYKVSTGNEVDIQLADFIEHFATDPAVGTFVLYAEQIRNPKRFLAAVAKARAAGKHLVMLHPGRSAKGQKAAASHTGALAGDYRMMATAVENAGVLLVDSLETLVDATEVLVRFPQPPAKGVAVLATSGAYCAHANDVCEEIGLELPQLSPAVMRALEARMPDYLVLNNPVDMTTQVAHDLKLIGDCVELSLSDPNVGSVCLVTPIGNVDAALGDLQRMVAAQAAHNKPVLVAILGDDLALDPEYMSRVRQSGIIFSRASERHLRTLAKVTAYGKRLERHRQSAQRIQVPLGRVLEAATLAEWEGKRLLSGGGVPVAEGELVEDVDGAIRVASRLGFPVALKLQSRSLTHKTEIGAVLLGISDEQQLRSSWTKLLERARASRPEAKIDGVLVERMSPKGLELMVGAKRDPEWGPFVMFGLGGIWVEALNDVRVLPADVDVPTVEEELRLLRTSRLLGEFRGAPARDITAVAKVVTAVGRLMLAHPEIDEIDINPLMVMAAGQGVLALDALVVVGERRAEA